MAEEIRSISFVPCKETWRDGFLIPVRNKLNNMLQNEFLPSEYKDKYIEDWGHEILYDEQFIDWYCDLKNTQ